MHKERYSGFILFEVAVFLMLFSISLGLYVQTQYIKNYTGSAFVFSVKIKEFTTAFQQYLDENYKSLDYGVSEIPISKIIKSGQIGAGTTGFIGDYVIKFYADRQILNGRDSISGLVTATAIPNKSPLNKSKINYIEGLLGPYGGQRVGDSDIVNGNWNLWVLNLKKWKLAQTAQLFSYFPDSLELSQRLIPSPQPAKIYSLSFENCSFSHCETSELPAGAKNSQPSLMEWVPFYNEDYFRITIRGDENVDYYAITLTVASERNINSMEYNSATTAGGITLLGKDYNNIDDAYITVSIRPVTSLKIGDPFIYTLHKRMPQTNELANKLWKSFDIAIESDSPDDYSSTERCRHIHSTEKFVDSKNGKLSYVDFIPKSPFSLAYDVVFSFFGNKFFFPKNGGLSLSYFYSDRYYPWFFINHPDKNNGAIFSCIVEGDGETKTVPDAAIVIKDKQYNIQGNINMSSWSKGNHIVHITLK
ncbi:hypothetical protein ECIG_04733 [Escherichia coli M605]|uniref:Uncharacterized protein n=2 Tax=Escherichia coli TaxID=562 RepID=F4SY93_ECOLX|nr:hypothetical protein ECIG_04733 [Escherichia coli M605]